MSFLLTLLLSWGSLTFCASLKLHLVSQTQLAVNAPCYQVSFSSECFFYWTESILKGLPCGSQKKLVSGSFFEISSRLCSDELYPNSERCHWYFDVQDCIPSISCASLDIRGMMRRRYQYIHQDIRIILVVVGVGAIDWLLRQKMMTQSISVVLEGKMLLSLPN